MTEKTNAKQYPEFYYARHMKEGVCGYGDETVLLRDDTIKAMTKSFNGKPLYVLHDSRTEKERINTLETTADGYVTDSFYNELDGWYWTKMMVVSEAGHKAVANGWAVSNAYIPTGDAKGGTKHNVPYQREITNAYYTHLAIVPNPRYEEAKIFTPDEFNAYQDERSQQLKELRNSNEEEKGFIMKFFKRQKEEVSKVDADTFIEITNDDGEVSEVLVSDMIAAVSTKKEAALQNEAKDEIDLNATVKISEDEEMTLKELINSYSEIKNAKADKEDEIENECDDEDEKENEYSDDEKSEDDADEKQNHMDELKNAHKGESAPVAKPYLKLDGLALGKSKY